MSYCLVRNIMVPHVRNQQLTCSLVKLKLSGPDSASLYNFQARILHGIFNTILLEQESDRDCLPTLAYRDCSKVMPGQGGVLKRIEQQAKEENIECRMIDLYKDSVLSVASLFWLTHNGVVCNVLETDKEELAKKTVFITGDRDVDYAGQNVVPIYCDQATFDVEDSCLGTNLYVLQDALQKTLVTVNK